MHMQPQSTDFGTFPLLFSSVGESILFFVGYHKFKQRKSYKGMNRECCGSWKKERGGGKAPLVPQCPHLSLRVSQAELA